MIIYKSPPLHGDVGAEMPHERHAFLAPRGHEHPGAAPLRELDGEQTHAAGRAVDDKGLALRHVQHVVDTLERHEAGARDHAGVLEVEPFGDGRRRLGHDCHVLGVKAALRVVEAV